ncbi:MAG: PSD1 domain-containing protein [Opitutaceae bacterium]|nr:PSD1 domain-containing protein [Opitutaceae bacterium]
MFSAGPFRSSAPPARRLQLLLALGSGVGLLAAAGAAERPEALQVLETHCVECHGGEKTKAGLDLTTRAALLRGGESGAAVVPGRPEASLLVRLVSHRDEPGMPHKQDPLSAELQAVLTDWVAAGVPYTRSLTTVPAVPAVTRSEFALTPADRAHWAFQPVRRPDPPAVSDATWAAAPLDGFILARLDAAGLRPAPPASRTTLIRRVTLDLIGLPPTPAEVDAFVADPAPDAYARLVERLLASPHYGERWGRHWLDLARFAETDGFEHDAVRPHAWRYRDYVVRAFNADKPFDRFIREQVAGDELYPSEPDALIATAFNLLGPDMVDSADQVQRRRNTLNDATDTTALAFLGLTLGCARCHDHKFEPLSQRDYYAFQAHFAAAKFRPDLPVPSPAERAAHDAELQRYNEQTATLQAAIAALEDPYRRTIHARKLARLSAEAQAAHTTPAAERTTEQENQIQETAAQLLITPKELSAAMKPPDRKQHQALLEQLKPFPKPKPLPATLALQNGPRVRTHVLHRGDYSQPGAEVSADVPEVLRIGRARSDSPSGGAFHPRTALAEWIASPANPLTARVAVNRLWQHHFGRGLVPSPSDFGTNGQKPTHPELLDWLASEFVARGWSLKAMHRLMLLSATYQQASPPAVADPRTARIDPDNRLYARMSRRRLEGEVIRDSLLAISGQLNPKLGGPGVFPPIPAELFEGAKGWTPSPNPADHTRRSLYIFARRNLRFPFLEVFDAPDSNLSCPSRERSTTAPQSLALLNAHEVLGAAARTADRIEREAAAPDDRVTLAYRLILGRPPTASEARVSREFLQASPTRELCRALFNLNAFVYVD